jgi:hypothetical protein
MTEAFLSGVFFHVSVDAGLVNSTIKFPAHSPTERKPQGQRANLLSHKLRAGSQARAAIEGFQTEEVGHTRKEKGERKKRKREKCSVCVCVCVCVCVSMYKTPCRSPAHVCVPARVRVCVYSELGIIV